eukprot:996624-Pyramimonas_sp.AAC.1
MALSCLYGRGDGPDLGRLSSGQCFRHQQVRDAVRRVGTPDVSGAAAIRELCASAPGYLSEPQRPPPSSANSSRCRPRAR